MKNPSRQYKNQRLGKAKPKTQQVLEVSVRREVERDRKVRRAISSVAWLVLVAAMLVGSVLGIRIGIKRYIWENPALYLTDVRVKSDGVLTREQILQAGEVALGTNSLLVKEDKIRAALIERLPQIDRVTVQRSLPHRLDIEITERQPVAWLTESADVNPSSSERAFLVDKRGVAMKPRPSQREQLPLPIISGVEVGNLIPGQKANIIQVSSALDLLHANADNTRWQIKNIDISKRYCLVATDRNHVEVTFDLEDVDRQLMKLNRLFEFLERPENKDAEHRDLRTVNLLIKYNTPVTFFGDEPEEAVAATPITPGKTDKSTKSESKPAPKAAKPESSKHESPSPEVRKSVIKKFRLIQ